jgi:hypothetical protein
MDDRLFKSGFDIVKRIYELTPFESGTFINDTRPTYSNVGYNPELDLGTATATQIRLNYALTEKLYNILLNNKNPKEFEISGKNLMEVYTEYFNDLGGVPEVIHTDEGEAMLDIRLFYNKDPEIVNIDKYQSYSSNNESKYYATGLEINSDNIVDEGSLYTSGDKYGKVTMTDTAIYSEYDAKLELEVPIDVISKVEVSLLTNQSETLE